MSQESSFQTALEARVVCAISTAQINQPGKILRCVRNRERAQTPQTNSAFDKTKPSDVGGDVLRVRKTSRMKPRMIIERNDLPDEDGVLRQHLLEE